MCVCVCVGGEGGGKHVHVSTGCTYATEKAREEETKIKCLTHCLFQCISALVLSV